MKRISPTESFWTFANRLYEQAGIADQLLQWQDSLGADVNMVLFACWHGATRGRFSKSLLGRAALFSRQWSQAITVPLRNGRRWMKTNALDSEDANMLAQFSLLRDAIKQLELQGEQFQENMLESFVEAVPVRMDNTKQHADISANLLGYAQIAALDEHIMRADMAAIIDATIKLIASDQAGLTAP